MMEMDTYTQIRVFTFAMVCSVMLAALLPVLAPVNALSMENAEQVMAQRTELQDFTGASMINQAPFVLTGVYTPYIPGQSEDRVTDDGALYGESISPYILDGKSYIGRVSDIKLDPEHKSDFMLDPTEQKVVSYEERLKDWAEYRSGIASGDIWDWGLFDDLRYWFHNDVLNEDPYEIVEKPIGGTVWAYTGYRYVFHPSLTVDYEEDDNQKSTDRISLSIVWYDDGGVEGISGGVILYETTTKRLLANLTANEIIGTYDIYNNKASVYTLSFEGLPIKMAIRFDPLVLDGSQNLYTAWSNGDWSIGFYAASINNLLDRDNSMAYSLSFGGIIETYQQIFTMSYPSLGAGWDVIVWILCSMPLLIVLVGVFVNILGAIKVPFAG